MGTGLPGIGMRWAFGKEGAMWVGRMLADWLSLAVSGLEGLVGGSVLVHCACHLVPFCGVCVRVS